MSAFSVNGMAAFAMPLAEELDLYRRIDAAVIGLPVLKLAAMGWSAADELIASSGLELGYLFLPFGAGPQDTRGWADQIDLLSAAVSAAARHGAPTVYFTTGPSGKLSWEEAAERLGERLAPVLGRARDLGVTVAVENSMSIRGDISFVHSLKDSAALAEQLDLGLCVDLYCAWQERDLLGTIAGSLERVRLVQVSDFRVGTFTVPNRWVPGDGDLPLERLLAGVWDLGYQGLVDLELAGPAIDTEGAEGALSRGLSWLAALQ